MSDSYYETAQICLNGHVINEWVHEFPAHNSKFCSECGEATTTTCECGAEIRGKYIVPGVFGGHSEYVPPNYCFSCGKSFPWIEQNLAAARDLTDELDELSHDDKEKLKNLLVDLTKDTPRTEVAKKRFTKIMSKVGADSYEALKSILVKVATEAAKSALT